MKSIFKNSIIVAALLLGAASVSHAQVKVGDNPATINAGAALEIESTNKGFLPPRLALTGGTDATTIPAPAKGMVVYNTATAGTAPNNIVPGLVVNNGTPASPSWANVQVFSDETGSKVDKLRYLGAINDTRTVIIDNFYEFRVRVVSGTAVSFEFRLISDPVTSHGVHYNRHAYLSTGSFPANTNFTFTGGPSGNWNIFRSFDQPNQPTGQVGAYNFMLSSPQRDRLIEGRMHYSFGLFVNSAFTSY